jgi:two-component system response regulator (stage 0 sporulation protein F)
MGTRRKTNRVGFDDDPQSSERARPPRIIVADEDNGMRDRVTCALREDGYAVLEATNGFELLDHISTSLLVNQVADQPDGIIMALWMPGVSGLSILGGLRDAKWPMPILLMTEALNRDLRETYRRLGANAIFEKPFDVDDLRTVVLNLVPGAIRNDDRHSTIPVADDVFAATG